MQRPDVVRAMDLLGTSQQPSTAEAAARRLACSKPLYPLSLYTALSQLLCFKATQDEDTCLASICNAFAPSSPPTNCAVTSEGIAREVAELNTTPSQRTQLLFASPAVESKHVEFKRPWLTRNFVAQVRVHFEAAIRECSFSYNSAKASAFGSEAETCDDELFQKEQYRETLSKAALHWALLLLLTAEQLLFGGKHEGNCKLVMPDCRHFGKDTALCEAMKGANKSTPASKTEVVYDPEDTMAAADTVVRGKKM